MDGGRLEIPLFRVLAQLPLSPPLAALNALLLHHRAQTVPGWLLDTRDVCISSLRGSCVFCVSVCAMRTCLRRLLDQCLRMVRVWERVGKHSLLFLRFCVSLCGVFQ